MHPKSFFYLTRHLSNLPCVYYKMYINISVQTRCTVWSQRWTPLNHFYASRCVHLHTLVWKYACLCLLILQSETVLSHRSEGEKLLCSNSADFCKDWTWHSAFVKLHQGRTHPLLFHFTDREICYFREVYWLYVSNFLPEVLLFSETEFFWVSFLFVHRKIKRR